MSKAIKILILLALASLVTAVALSLFLRTRLSVDSVVAELEKTCNLRAQVGACEVKVFARPSQLVIEKLLIAPRDAVVEAGIPHSQREPIIDEASILGADKVELEINLRDLLGWELNIRKLAVHGLRGKIEIDQTGGDSVAPLFEKVGKKTPQKTPMSEDKPVDGDNIKAEKKPVSLPFPATMELAAISAGSLSIINHRQGSRANLEDFQLELTNITVDTNDLRAKNRCDITLSTHLTMANLKTGEAFLDFNIRGEGQARPLDTRDGSFSPSLDAEVTVTEGSSVSGLPFLSMLSGSIDALSRVGLKLGDLKSRSLLSQDMTTSLLYEEGKLLFRNPLDFDFDRYALGLGEGSWLNLETLVHEFKGRITISEELTAEARDGVEKFIRDKAGNTAADVATDSILTPLMNKAGRLTLSFLSSGPLPDPDVGVCDADR